MAEGLSLYPGHLASPEASDISILGNLNVPIQAYGKRSKDEKTNLRYEQVLYHRECARYATRDINSIRLLAGTNIQHNDSKILAFTSA